MAGISFGGQMHGLVMLDEKDEVIRPAILWNDGRTGKETDYLNQVHRKRQAVRVHGQHCLRRLYCPEDSLGKENMSRKTLPGSCKIMLPKDYLAYTSDRQPSARTCPMPPVCCFWM